MAIPSAGLASGEVPSCQSKPVDVGGSSSGISVLDGPSDTSVADVCVVSVGLCGCGVLASVEVPDVIASRSASGLSARRAFSRHFARRSSEVNFLLSG